MFFPFYFFFIFSEMLITKTGELTVDAEVFKFGLFAVVLGKLWKSYSSVPGQLDVPQNWLGK